MYLFIRISLLTLFSSFWLANAQPVSPDKIDDGWTLEKEGDGIKVYTRIENGASIKEFKAITYTEQSMTQLENIIGDVENYPNWQANLSSASVIKTLNENERYIYYTTDMPWPIEDRDILVYTVKRKLANGTVSYSHKSAPDYIEEKEDFLRIKISQGSWTLIPAENNKIKIVYKFYGDPAGNLPDWVINIFIVSGPYDTLYNMKNL